jgi:hypothetical protein
MALQRESISGIEQSNPVTTEQFKDLSIVTIHAVTGLLMGPPSHEQLWRCRPHRKGFCFFGLAGDSQPDPATVFERNCLVRADWRDPSRLSAVKFLKISPP